MRFIFCFLIVFSFSLCNSVAEVISYNDNDVVEDFLVLPNEERDHSFNVRFTPAEGQFELTGMQIALFDNYGDAGSPGMRISIASSENGHPASELLDSMDVSSDNLVMSGEEITWNEISFPEFDLIFDRPDDFHIIVNVIQNDESDTLAVFVDSGEFQPSNRSGIWSSAERQWVHLIDLYGMGHNFLIRAVVRYGAEDYAPNETEALQPFDVFLNSCYPNPFNSTLNVPFYISKSDHVTIGIFDINGVYISPVVSDNFQTGFHNAVWEAEDFTAGVYFVKFTTADFTTTGKVVLIK